MAIGSLQRIRVDNITKHIRSTQHNLLAEKIVTELLNGSGSGVADAAGDDDDDESVALGARRSSEKADSVSGSERGVQSTSRSTFRKAIRFPAGTPDPDGGKAEVGSADSKSHQNGGNNGISSIETATGLTPGMNFL